MVHKHAKATVAATRALTELTAESEAASTI